jgi:hypothetical protein
MIESTKETFDVLPSFLNSPDTRKSNKAVQEKYFQTKQIKAPDILLTSKQSPAHTECKCVNSLLQVNQQPLTEKICSLATQDEPCSLFRKGGSKVWIFLTTNGKYII